MDLIAELVREIAGVLDAHRAHMEIFSKAEGNFEDWFRGEFLALLDGLKHDRKIDAWDTQVSPDGGPGLMDATVRRGADYYAIELKGWLIGKQGNGSYGSGSWLDPYYMGEDIEKLARWGRGRRFIMAFFHPKPKGDGWKDALAKLPAKFPGRTLVSLEELKEDGKPYFIAVLELE